MKGQAEGIVYSTKPLSYQGQLIDEFWIRFHEGKAVEWNAQVNNDLLTKLITMDQGSCYLGECALVPFDSPINQSGLLFYNTLFDENACCHLALGMGFADTIRDFQSKTLEECRAMRRWENRPPVPERHLGLLIRKRAKNTAGKSGGIFLWIPYRRGSVPAQVIPQIGRFSPPILMKHQSGESATGFFKKF